MKAFLTTILQSLWSLLAEREGFEPPVPCGTTDFETATFDHSAISPMVDHEKRRLTPSSEIAAKIRILLGSQKRT